MTNPQEQKLYRSLIRILIPLIDDSTEICTGFVLRLGVIATVKHGLENSKRDTARPIYLQSIERPDPTKDGVLSAKAGVEFEKIYVSPSCDVALIYTDRFDHLYRGFGIGLADAIPLDNFRVQGFAACKNGKLNDNTKYGLFWARGVVQDESGSLKRSLDLHKLGIDPERFKGTSGAPVFIGATAVGILQTAVKDSNTELQFLPFSEWHDEKLKKHISSTSVKRIEYELQREANQELELLTSQFEQDAPNFFKRLLRLLRIKSGQDCLKTLLACDIETVFVYLNDVLSNTVQKSYVGMQERELGFEIVIELAGWLFLHSREPAEKQNVIAECDTNWLANYSTVSDPFYAQMITNCHKTEVPAGFLSDGTLRFYCGNSTVGQLGFDATSIATKEGFLLQIYSDYVSPASKKSVPSLHGKKPEESYTILLQGIIERLRTDCMSEDYAKKNRKYVAYCMDQEEYSKLSSTEWFFDVSDELWPRMRFIIYRKQAHSKQLEDYQKTITAAYKHLLELQQQYVKGAGA